MTAMDCWSVLNIERDADERSIKRQYARLLKTTRPDDDPAAFQNLRDAYEQALSRARSRVNDEEDETFPGPFLIRNINQQRLMSLHDSLNQSIGKSCPPMIMPAL